MRNAILLKTGSALAVVLHIGLNSASFAAVSGEVVEIREYTPLVTNYQANYQTDGDLELGLSSITASQAEDVVLDINDDATNALAKLKQESDKANSNLDKAIKASLIAGGVAVGGALAWFYGPALAYTVASKASLALFTLANPNASWFTYKFIAVPASIDVGVYFATSNLTNLAIGAASSTLGYGLGNAACGAYEATKSGLGWLKGKVFG